MSFSPSGIPPELGNLRNLEHIEFDSNHPTGPILSELGSLQHLEYIKLNSNRLTGPIPPELRIVS